MTAISPNFSFLEKHDPLLVKLAAQAERYFADDPNTTLIKLRQFAEVLAQRAAATAGVYVLEESSLLDVLNRLWDRGAVTREVSQLFHALRKAGNLAAHEHAGTHRDALHGIKAARTLAIWFHKSFGNQPGYKAGPFVVPPDPSKAQTDLKDELAQLRAALAAKELEAAKIKKTAAAEAKARQEAEEQAQAVYADLTAAMSLAEETEEQLQAERTRYEEELASLQAQAAAAPADQVEAVIQQAQEAGESSNLDLDEADTRAIIDEQLRQAGWDADTVALTFAKGVRPQKGKNVAISEWPTSSGPADYVLFAGLVPVAVVEAKRKRKDVAGAIEQSKRYSRDYVIHGDEKLAGGPWGKYKVPFLFATNGRPFLRQIKTKSGIWFLDARQSTNHPRALEGWYTPDGLLDLLAQDIAAADGSLKDQSTDYLPLRDYQHAAVKAVENAIAKGKQDMLLAMATGTGKTRLALCLIYRLIKAGRFRRVLFLVDRTALGEQAHNAFKDVRLENLQSLTEIYDVKGLGDLKPDTDTRLHVATVQGMVKRLMYPSDEDELVPVDWYDCVIIDECHRGYNLDREMSDSEVTFRSEQDYISKYRRVLDHLPQRQLKFHISDN